MREMRYEHDHLKDPVTGKCYAHGDNCPDKEK